jgi:hypothetical protein
MTKQWREIIEPAIESKNHHRARCPDNESLSVTQLTVASCSKISAQAGITRHPSFEVHPQKKATKANFKRP